MFSKIKVIHVQSHREYLHDILLIAPKSDLQQINKQGEKNKPAERLAPGLSASLFKSSQPFFNCSTSFSGSLMLFPSVPITLLRPQCCFFLLVFPCQLYFFPNGLIFFFPLSPNFQSSFQTKVTHCQAQVKENDFKLPNFLKRCGENTLPFQVTQRQLQLGLAMQKNPTPKEWSPCSSQEFRPELLQPLLKSFKLQQQESSCCC